MPPANAGRPSFDIADIVRQHRAQLQREVRLTVGQRRALSAIEMCRTAALGGHVELCRSCGYEHVWYNSCRNRHCPKCQALAQQRWIDARSGRMLPVRHFHVVFTLPSQLRRLAHWQPKAVFDALFTSASQTLLELGRSRLRAQLGITMVLHTWTRELRLHPHVHAIVTAGGVALEDERWISSSTKYLFPVEIMGELLRAKMLAALNKLHAQARFDGFDDFRDPEGFDRLMQRLARVRWLVYAKKPFRHVDHVLAYLGRYTHRVAISNSRLVNVTEDAVCFRTKNGQSVTITPVQFLRRFVLHVLPSSFVKIRHYGLLAATNVNSKLLVARRALAYSHAHSATKLALYAIAEQADTENQLAVPVRIPSYCPLCGAELVTRALSRPLCRPSTRSPP